MNFYLSQRNFTILSTIAMVWAYVEMMSAKNIYVILCLFVTFCCMVFVTCYTRERLVNYFDRMFTSSLFVSFLIYQGIHVVLFGHKDQHVLTAIFCVFVVILIIANLYCFLLMIEDTEWYKALERGREELLEQEASGAAPDLKDFE